MMAGEPAHRTQRQSRHFAGIDFGIGQLAKIGQVQLLLGVPVACS
jgi:hypothetical protein